MQFFSFRRRVAALALLGASEVSIMKANTQPHFLFGGPQKRTVYVFLLSFRPERHQQIRPELRRKSCYGVPL